MPVESPGNLIIGNKIYPSSIPDEMGNTQATQDIAFLSPPTVVRTPHPFPSVESAKKGDAALQEQLSQWLLSGEEPDSAIPPKASISPFLKLYTDALQTPEIQAWFKTHGLDPSTVRVYSDCVTGTAKQNGQEVVKRFSLTDGSGWWAISAQLHAAHKLLASHGEGLPAVANAKGGFLPLHLVLKFYGVPAPANERAAPALARQLDADGWPQMTRHNRAQSLEQYTQQTTQSSDVLARVKLADTLNGHLQATAPGAVLKLDNQPFVVEIGSSLEQRSSGPRKAFLKLLRSDLFRAFLNKSHVSAAETDFRISAGDLQVHSAKEGWVSLQDRFDYEFATPPLPDHGKIEREFIELVKHSQQSGNALYSARAYDVRQALDFYSKGSPRTVAQVNLALTWLKARVAPAPLAGDYAGLTPYDGTPGTLSAEDLVTLKESSQGLSGLLRAAWQTPDSGNLHDNNFDSKLAQFFDSPLIVAQTQAWAEALKLHEVADGQPLSRAVRHQLAATALKLSAGFEVPGKPGVVAGYNLYQPSNIGRTLKELRGDVEKHLKGLGVDAAIGAPMAYLLMAQAAPEMLVKAGTTYAPDAPQLLRQDPDQIRVGSAVWMELRLGCAIAETLSGVGSSRMMHSEQLLALGRLQPQDPDQELLLKSLGMKPLMDWAVMEGVMTEPADGRFTPQHYAAAAEAFTHQQDAARTALTALTTEPPTLTSVLLKQLALLFPEMTEDELSAFKLTRVYDSRQNHLPQTTPLTQVLLAQQEGLKGLAAANDFFKKVHAGEVKFKFNHPRISQAAFDERIQGLPEIAALIPAEIDRHIAAQQTAQATMIKLMIAQLPANERQALETGKIDFFRLRKATGQTADEERGEDSRIRAATGTHGTVIRYEVPGTPPDIGYYEVFPESMRMIKRTDLPPLLNEGGLRRQGALLNGQSGPVYKKEITEKFDFEAYRTGEEPRVGAHSDVIIERVRPSLRASVPATASVTSSATPGGFTSQKVADITRGIQANSFDDQRAALTAHANRPTEHQIRQAWPFGENDVISPGNIKAVLSLIPFVGAITDLAEGKFASGFRGLAIDFASYAVTGGLAALSKFVKGVKVVLPFSGRAFSVKGLGGAPAILRGLFNPLDGVISVFKASPKILSAAKAWCRGAVKGSYLPTTAFEKGRWCLGAYDTFNGLSSEFAYPGKKWGTYKGDEFFAVQKNSVWYAVNPQTEKPEGVPLTGFVPHATATEPTRRLH